MDISRPFLDWGRQHFANNRLSIREHEFVSRDVFDTLVSFEQQERRFSVVLLDPPPFVQGGGEEGEKEADSVSIRKQDHYARLVSMAAAVVEQGGLLVAFSNTRSVRLSSEFFSVSSLC